MGGTVTRPGQSASPGPGARRRAFAARLDEAVPIVLDGATGTELERRGVSTPLPLWSARALLEAPDVLERIHRDYVEAGAEVLTADTFRTQTRTLARAGRGDQAPELTARAVALARRAALDAAPARPVRVAGSMPPLEDCYRPDLVPADAALAREHAEHAANLVAAGADLLLLETHNCVREAVAAAGAARETGLPFWVSFVCDADAHLLSGEPLAVALEAVSALGPDLVGVNCLPPRAAAAALPILAASGRPFGVYANLGTPAVDTGKGWSDACTPRTFAAHAADWIAAGARAVGGCCGTGPAHVRAITRRLGRSRTGRRIALQR
jgi:S-methylmethionine-dependent homocysteine/selenocysteine methylase